MKTVFCSVVFTVCFFTWHLSDAQYFRHFRRDSSDGSPNTLLFQIGLEPEIISELGYSHRIGPQDRPFRFQVGTSVKFAPLLLNHPAVRLNFIGGIATDIGNHWTTVFKNALYWAHDRNREGTMDGLGFEWRSITLHKGHKWYCGGELCWQYGFTTHIKHSKEAKITFRDRYPEGINGIAGPKDGWYGASVSRFRAGFVTGTHVGNHFWLQAAVGTLFSLQHQGIFLAFSHGQVPAYFESGLSYQW